MKPLDLTPLLEAIADACKAGELPSLHTLIGTLAVLHHKCLKAASRGLPHSGKVSQGREEKPLGSGRVHDRWISPKEGARRLGISVRTLTRRSTKPPYSAFCIPQPRGFKVSEVGLEDFQRHARA